MAPRYNLFTKIVILIVIMLIPIVSLYFYSNKTSTDVIGTELNKANTNQLTFFQNQIDADMDLISSWPNLLIHDPDIFNFKDIFLESEYFNLDEITLVKRIQTKLKIQESSMNWKSSLSIYSPTLNRVVTVNDAATYDKDTLLNRIKPGWQVTKDGERYVFSMVKVYPYSAFSRPEDANLIIEIAFDNGNFEMMLNKFKSDGRGDPFYYKRDEGIIYNQSSDRKLVTQLIDRLEKEQLQDTENITVNLDGEKYLVGIVTSKSNGWKLIDYIPLSDIVLPIEKTNLLFYISVSVLLMMSFLAAYLLYAQVQVPIKQLVLAFQKLKNADYTIRLVPKGKNEFSFLFARFNLMVVQIQELFENVYVEKIAVREAKLKQLQSQINPHFFYNCFSFISSMAKLKDYQSVIAMSENLANYYRYTTRQERDLVPLSEEIAFVTNYLEIQKMRMKWLDFTIHIPETMRKLLVPPLLIQPLVENAVIHGIETTAGAGKIRIEGVLDEQQLCMIVEDDGKGMTSTELLALQYKLSEPMQEETGCGLWNVKQRIQLRYGEDSDVTISPSQLGGLKVNIHWKQSTH